MILTSLTLENIGSFYGRHEIDLSPTNSTKPIVLIGALNGSGKTTILESLQLVLYGRRAKALFRIKTGYDEYLTKLFNRKASPADPAGVELEFSNDEAGATVRYRIVRSWTFQAKAPVESTYVYVDDQLDSVLSDTWDEEVERLIPLNLAHLFFFDGERIETLADPSQSAEILRTGIYSLLGIELVDQLHGDLNVYRRRLKKAQARPEEIGEISEIEDNLASQEQLRSALMDQVASVNKDLDAAKKRLVLSRENFEKHGGTIYENRNALDKEKIEIASALQQLDDSLRELCAHSLPLGVAGPELQSLADSVCLEKESIESQRLLSNLTTRDEKFMGWLDDQSNTLSELSATIGEYLASDRQELRQTASVEPVINMPDEAFAQLSTLVKSGMSVEKAKAAKLIDKRKQISIRLDSIERSMELMPEKSVIRTYLEEKVHAETKCDLLAKERNRIDELLSKARLSISATEKELERLLADIKDTELATEESQRLANYSARIQHVLDQLKQRTLVSHLAKLESHISDAFGRLLRKDCFVQSVHIHPETFNVVLRSRGGHEIPAQLLSAGERQILAVAILWGLGRAAGRKIPIVIDTPLGRLDSVHRKRLVEEYFPEASHQVILLSTDEEIDEELSADLDDSIAHRYILHYDDTTEFTSVKRGYFWQ